MMQSLSTSEIPTILDFSDLELKQVKVPYKGKQYILVEASEDAVVKWRNAQFKNARVSEKGNIISMGDIASSEPYLVSMCLYVANTDGKLPVTGDGLPDTAKLVKKATLEAWPSRVVSKLFDTLKQISELEETENKESLEKKFVDTAQKLVKLSDNDVEKGQWREWMVGECHHACDGTTSPKDVAKNEQGATTDTSE